MNKEENINYMQLGAQQGWQCPICKRVLSPWTTECPCKGQGSQTWTTTSITLNDYDKSWRQWNDPIITYYGNKTTDPLPEHQVKITFKH